MRRHLGIRRIVAAGGEEEVGETHARKDSGDGRGGARDRAYSHASLGPSDYHSGPAPEVLNTVVGVTAMLVIVGLLAVAFDYTNGFHDTANAIATSVATRALSPRRAIVMAAVLNLVGALIYTGAVSYTH